MTKILLATVVGDPTFKRGLGWLLKEIKAVEVVTESFEAEGFIKSDKKTDVVIIDTGNSIVEGIKSAKLILDYSPESKIILLTYFDDAAYSEMILSSGVHCLLKKPFSLKTLTEAISNTMKRNVSSQQNGLQTFYKNQ
ncbi:MAG: response regulator transcription factor [Ignavibacterium sp.]|jgi:DNA-binding NarL/FixJ family response regulator|nr:response regulator transcription factor [Ignavibacterium sp.]